MWWKKDKTAYCNKCGREVGIELVGGNGAGFWLLIILGLVIPVWPVTLPLFWILAFVVKAFSEKKVCGVCKAPISKKAAA